MTLVLEPLADTKLILGCAEKLRNLVKRVSILRAIISIVCADRQSATCCLYCCCGIEV